MNEFLTACYRDPFALGSPVTARFPAGLRLSEMVERMPYLPRSFADDGEIRIDGALVIAVAAGELSGRVAALATKLRLTPQARFHPRTAGRQIDDHATGPKPWETHG